jgi:hypothetical protein
MANLKYYNSGTEEWETLVIGKQGPTGPQGVPGNDGALSPNAIINGAFDIWQRGTSAATGLVYGADRWINFGTSPNSLINTNTPSSSFTSSNNVYGSTNTGIQQRIESLNASPLVGQSVTVSFWARNYSSSGQFRVSLDYANAVNNFSSITNVSSSSTETIAPSGSLWNRYTFTFNALPNQVSNGLAVTINLTGTSSVGFLITGVQLEAGTVATPFRRNAPSIQAELAACQRYYQRISSSGILCNAAYYDNNVPYGALHLPVTMRATPSGSFSAGDAISVFQNNLSTNSVTAGVSNLTPTTARISVTGVAGAAGRAGWFELRNGFFLEFTGAEL